MNLAILSGKGGTGKTFIATNLAMYMKSNYLDADVEEPNGFIFLKPKVVSKKNVFVENPIIDKEKCINCGKCANFCEFNALAKINNNILVFEKLCHSCGGCNIICPQGAIKYNKRNIGIIEEGENELINCKRGILNIGEPMATKVIESLLEDINIEKYNIIDSPPGTSCNVVNVLQKTDVAILVTEVTKFGLHDLDRAVKLVKKFNIPFGVIINRVIDNNSLIEDYLKNNNIVLLGKIRYDKNIAKTYSKGDLIVKEKEYEEIFESIFKKIKENLLCK